MNDSINNVFLELKPICDTIVSNPTQDKLIELREIINKCAIPLIQRLHEYIIFPLYINLNKETSSNIIKQELLDTLQCVLDKIKLNKIKIFLELFIVITKQIFDKQTATLIAGTDEELKLSAIICLNTLFKSISSDIITDLYSNTNKVYFPQCIYMCVQIAKHEKMRKLRLNVINCLMTICYVHDEADYDDKVLRNQVADCVMFFLPGIAIALQEISIDDEKQGHKITSLALKALNRIIILHMEDEECEESKEIIFEFPLRKIEEKIEEEKKEDISELMKKLQITTRSADWYNKTSQNLFKIIENLSKLQSHYHEVVRFELSNFCEQILTKCPVQLENTLSICIEILISLSEDDNPKVSESSKNALKLIPNYLTLIDVLSENFYNVVNSLPRIINGTDTHKQLSSLNLLVGYLRLLGSENLFRILQNPDRLKRFLKSLIFISTLEKSNVTLFEEYTIRDFESISETAITWKQFKYIDDKVLFNKFQIALHLLSHSEAVEIIVDSLSEIFSSEYENRSEVVFLLNEIISVDIKSSKNSERLINSILKMYIEEENWYLSTDTTEFTLLETHNNIIQMCLLVEGIGCMSNALKLSFKNYLLKILYIVLERAGSAQPLMSAAGLFTLSKISQNCEYKSVTDLIVQNTDYFSFHVIKRLKKLDLNIAVLDVLNVVMKYSTIEVLPSIMYVVNEVLLYSSDKYQQQNISSFLKVFHSFLQSLNRWKNMNTQIETRYIYLLKEYKKNMDVLYEMYTKIDLSDSIMDKSAEELYKEDMSKIEDELQTEDEQEPEKVELSEEIKLAVDILKRSLNFLPSKSREQKLLTLNILKDGLEIIKNYENELLPIVHLIWSPFIDRFKEDDALIINKSFELLIVLARLSKDFIRMRTSKDVLPEICKTIKNLAVKSYLKDRGAAYRYNQEYKLQLIILNDFAQLVTNLEMSTNDVDLVLKATKPYLSCRQPVPLQENLINCYKSLACYDFDSVWFNLLDVRSNQDNDDVKKNSEIILKQLEVIHW